MMTLRLYVLSSVAVAFTAAVQAVIVYAMVS